MLRVIGGELKRRKLDQPSLDITRPTKDIAKEGLFNSLGDISGLTFLDCFGGSGAIGIEAYSRGAKKVTIIEMNKEPYKVILKNLDNLHINDITVLNKDFYSAFKRLQGPFDIIFLDPPYKMEIKTSLIDEFKAFNLINGESKIIIERDEKLESAFYDLYNIKELKYGKSSLYIITLRS